ncbi:MAG: hypothetical protein PHQ62_03380 [Clostridia bacterium]|nr:hypothetical protein [Clostridia bacterium]
MTTILFCVTTKKISISEIKKQIKDILKNDIGLFFACEKTNAIVKEFETLKPDKHLTIQLSTFPAGTSEESMIENTLKNIPNSNFVLVRNDADFSVELIEKLIAESKHGFDIVMAKKTKKENFLSKFFSNISKKLCDLFFNFTFYEGDIGIQFFSEQAHSIMKSTNTTLLTKINRWIALNIKYIEFDFEKTNIKAKNYKNNITKTTIYFGLFVLTLVGAIILGSFININFIGGLLLFFVYIAFIALGLRSLMDVYTIKKIGNISCENINEIERKKL